MDEEEEYMAKFLCSVEAGIRNAVNTAIDNNFPNSGPGTFSAPYSADGNAPATHFVTSWRVSVAKKNLLVAFLTTNYPGQFQYDHVDYEDIDATLAGWGLVPLIAL